MKMKYFLIELSEMCEEIEQENAHAKKQMAIAQQKSKKRNRYR